MQRIIASCPSFWPGNRARMEKTGSMKMSINRKLVKKSARALPPSYKVFALIRTYHPKFVLAQMEIAFPAMTKGVSALEDKKPIVDMSNWACFSSYPCDRRCQKGACLFGIINIIGNWLINEGKFEYFVGNMRLNDPNLFKVYEKQKKGD
jgi:hypothetical protein